MNVCQTGVGVRGAACVRAIDANLSCQVTNDRTRAMTNPRPPCGGPSLLELLWERLMETYSEVLSHTLEWVDYQDQNDPMHFCEDRESRITSLWAARGKALGLAEAISIIVNPYAPDVDAVRAEAASRYEALEA